MKYNFDEETNRRGTHCVKWDAREDVPCDTIPMWVADMDFKAAQPIISALQKRAEEGIFGYTHVLQPYYDAITRWFDRWHGWHIDRSQVTYTTGVVPALAVIVKSLAKPGGKVLIQPPVYNCFFHCIVNNGCQVLENPLLLKGDRYYIDFDDLEKKAADEDCNLMLFCNPHNPAGRLWSADEMRRVEEICHRHGVLVVSDEIHCELVMPGYQYVPYANVAQHPWVACISPSKAFNTAGLHIANIVSSNQELKAKIDKAIDDFELGLVNPFGVLGLIAAYDESRDWLEQLLPYLHENYLLLKETFERELPELPVINLEATYLAWIDCRKINMTSVELEERLIKEAHVWLNPGSMYGAQGEGFMRINLACQRSRVATALQRMVPVLRNLIDTPNKQ